MAMWSLPLSKALLLLYQELVRMDSQVPAMDPGGLTYSEDKVSEVPCPLLPCRRWAVMG